MPTPLNLRTLVLHPFLLTTYAILTLAAVNIQELALEQAARSLAMGGAVAAALLLAGRLAFGDWHKGGLLASAVLLFFFSYGHVYASLEPVKVGGLILGRHRHLVPLSAVLMLLLIRRLARRSPPPRRTTRLLNTAAVVLLGFPAVTIGGHLVRTMREAQVNPLTQETLDELVVPPGTVPPDIYYIILDGYARSDYMRDAFGYDNSDFLRFLEERGFYVAERSRANYLHTALSLSSSLNMVYVEDLGVPLERGNYPSVFVGPIRNSLVRTQLGRLGYTTVAFRTGWVPSEWVDADYYYSPDPIDLDALAERPSMNAFESLLVWSSAAILLRDAGVDAFTTWAAERGDQPFRLLRQIILAEFDSLPLAASLPGPKFVFAHIVAPHGPFLFDAQGRPIHPRGPFSLAQEADPAAVAATEARYRDQAIYVTARIRQVLEEVLRQSATPPVVILQADHGAGVGEEWHAVDSPGLSQRAAILNAYLLPGGCSGDLYPSITPVNTFRLVFNCYFGGSYALLDDVSYFTGQPNLEGYRFVPIADPGEGG